MNELRELVKEILGTAVDLQRQEAKLRGKRASYGQLLDLYHRQPTAKALDDLKKLHTEGCCKTEGCSCGKGKPPAVGGKFFEAFDERFCVMVPTALPNSWKFFYALNYGCRQPWALVKLAVNPKGQVIVCGEITSAFGYSAENIVRSCTREMERGGVTEMVAEPYLWNRVGGGDSAADCFINAGINLVKSDLPKASAAQWDVIHELLRKTDAAGSRFLRIFATCEILRGEMEGARHGRNGHIDSGCSDHAIEALRIGLNSDLYRNAIQAKPEAQQ